MNEVIKLFAYIGLATVSIGIYLLAEAIWRKIKYRRKHKTKIKCLCKPHVYEPYHIWCNKEAEFRCVKCGKIKQIHIDRKSFEKWFGKGEKNE